MTDEMKQFRYSCAYGSRGSFSLLESKRLFVMADGDYMAFQDLWYIIVYNTPYFFHEDNYYLATIVVARHKVLTLTSSPYVLPLLD
ncbi:unnamed protein product [Rhodiola kirilowii]